MMTEAHVDTGLGAVYLKKLCRHFARNVPTTVCGFQGRIEFPFGPCRIDVNDAQMILHIEVSNPQNLDEAERTVTDHLLRMAREALTIQWIRSATTPEATKT